MILSLSLGLTGRLVAYPTPVDFEGNLSRLDVALEEPLAFYWVEDVDGIAAPEHYELIAAAAELWTNVEESFVELTETPDSEIAAMRVQLARSIRGGAYSAGYTEIDEAEAGKIQHCTITVALSPGLSQMSFAKTILHEFGHCLGLGHSLFPESIMSYDVASNRFALATDDAAAIARLYPMDGGDPRLPPGCAVGSLRGAFSAISIWFFILIPIFGLLPRFSTSVDKL